MQADGLAVPRRYWAIAAIILAITMSVLDSTIVNVALPSLAHDFRTSDAASIWVINSYQIAILIALLPLASLGEIVGYRRVSQCGLAVFTLASLAWKSRASDGRATFTMVLSSTDIVIARMIAAIAQ